MRLLSVTPVYPSPCNPEYGNFLENENAALARLGASVSVIYPRSVLATLRDRLTKKRFVVKLTPGIDVRRTFFWNCIWRRGLDAATHMRKADANYGRHLTRVLARTGTAADVVVAHFHESAAPCAAWSRRTGAKCVLRLHESSPDKVEKAHGPDQVRKVLRALDGIACVSKANKDFCLRLAPDLAERVIYIPNGYNPARFRPIPKVEARSLLGLEAQGSIAVFCGHFIERKGPLRVLAAVEEIPGLKAVFLGKGSQQPAGLRVLKAGPVPNAELPLWMCAGDVFVLPSLAEGLATVIVEAMGCGLPLVVSDRRFNTDFLTSDTAVFVDPQSSHSIADGLRRCLAPDRNRAMREAAIRRSPEFSLDAVAQRFLAFCRQLPEQPARGQTVGPTP
jgi:glycosyltransferase involved in cell wall biosynthesis